MARQKTTRRGPNYVSMVLGKTLADAVESDRQKQFEATGHKPGKAPLIKRILCEKYGLKLTCVAET